jgi:cytidylate kinase
VKAFVIVAIDGAAASGKTTTARVLAAKYGFMSVSTGEHYRAVTYKLLHMGVSPDDKRAVERALKCMEMGSKVVGSRGVVTLAGNRISDDILRSKEVNGRVMEFAHIACVRKFLFSYQRSQASIAREHGFFGLAIEGRDITSVVFPDADLRFFLYADVNERERRHNQRKEIDSIALRDSVDAPITLWQSGVIRIDTGFHDLQSVIDIISARMEEL